MPLTVRASSEVGGGTTGGAGQVQEEPHREFASAEHTSSMSSLEIGIMIGVIVVFGVMIGGLFYLRARKTKKAQVDQEAGEHPGTQEGGEKQVGSEHEEKDVMKGENVPSESFKQQLGRQWLGLKGGSKVEPPRFRLERV